MPPAPAPGSRAPLSTMRGEATSSKREDEPSPAMAASNPRFRRSTQPTNSGPPGSDPHHSPSALELQIGMRRWRTARARQAWARRSPRGLRRPSASR